MRPRAATRAVSKSPIRAAIPGGKGAAGILASLFLCLFSRCSVSFRAGTLLDFRGHHARDAAQSGFAVGNLVCGRDELAPFLSGAFRVKG